MPAEVYYSPYCRGCGDVRAPSRTVGTGVRWIDATTHLEAASRLRITALPALVIDGKLVAQGPPALRKLHAWLAGSTGVSP